MSSRRLVAPGVVTVAAALGACSLDDRVLTVHPALSAGGASGAANTSGGSAGSAGAGSGAGGAASGAGGSDPSGGASAGGSAGTSGGDNAGGSAGNNGGNGGANTGGDAGSGGALGGSGGTGTTLFFDDFEDGVADAWVAGFDDQGAPLGTWQVTNTGVTYVYECSSETSTTWAIVGDTTWTDQRVEVDFQFVSIGDPASSAAYVAARFASVLNHGHGYYAGDGYLHQGLAESGSTFDTGYVLRAVPQVGTWYRLAVVFEGATFSIYLDDVLEMSNAAPLTPNGAIALGARNAVVRFDNVRVTAP